MPLLNSNTHICCKFTCNNIKMIVYLYYCCKMNTKEVITQIGLYLHSTKIYELLTVNKMFKQTFCDDQYFWKLKYLHDFENNSSNVVGNDWKLLYFVPQPIKKPKTAYIFYASLKIKELIAKYPDKKVTSLTPMIAEEWKSFSNEQRKPFMDMAAKDMENYNNYNKRFLEPKPKFVAYATIRIKELQFMYPNKSLVDIVLIVNNEWKRMTYEQKMPYVDMIDDLMTSKYKPDPKYVSYATTRIKELQIMFFDVDILMISKEWREMTKNKRNHTLI